MTRPVLVHESSSHVNRARGRGMMTGCARGRSVSNSGIPIKGNEPLRFCAGKSRIGIGIIVDQIVSSLDPLGQRALYPGVYTSPPQLDRKKDNQMHDLASDDHWHEPTGLTSKAGLGTFKKPPMPYDVFMEEQEIPIVSAVVVSRVQD